MEEESQEQDEIEDGSDKDSSQLDSMMQGMEEDEFQDEALKMPSDLEGEDEEEGESEGLFPEDEEGSFPEEDDRQKSESESDGEAEIEDVFAQARQNKEMDVVKSLIAGKTAQTSSKSYVNQELVKKIEQIEDEMMNPKEWQLTGEARAAERPKDSLLEVHLDFNTATKLPPVITKETTNAIEALIK